MSHSPYMSHHVTNIDVTNRFCHGNVFCTWGGEGGGGHKNISKILATINFSCGENSCQYGRVYRNHKFKPNKSLDIPDCRSALFA